MSLLTVLRRWRKPGSNSTNRVSIGPEQDIAGNSYALRKASFASCLNSSSVTAPKVHGVTGRRKQ